MKVVIVNINTLYLHCLSRSINYFMFDHVVVHNLTGNKTLSIKKNPNANARQSQGIRLRCRASRNGKMNNFLHLFSKETQWRQIQCKREYEVTGLSNAIIHKVRYPSVQTATARTKIQPRCKACESNPRPRC